MSVICIEEESKAIAHLVGGELKGNNNLIRGISDIFSAKEEDLSFLMD